MLRDHLPEDPIPEPDVTRHNLAQTVVDAARESGVKVWERTANAGPPLVRLAELLSLVDYTATYLAIGLGHDPAGSQHVARLRDHTR
jgi:hypothetical protein